MRVCAYFRFATESQLKQYLEQKDESNKVQEEKNLIIDRKGKGRLENCQKL